MSRPTIAVVGASSDRRKFGNRAVRAYARAGYEVFPVHPREDFIEGLRAYRSVKDVPAAELDRVSVYLPPGVAAAALDDIAGKPARQVWFNPGADSPEVLAAARALGLNVIAGCSILDVGVDPHGLDG
jgi:predicted CoA-binding protein